MKYVIPGLPLLLSSAQAFILQFPNRQQSLLFDTSVDVVCIPGSDFDRPQKVNQDNYFIAGNFYGVMDGHGLKGHVLTEYLSKQLPAKLHEQLAFAAPVAELEDQVKKFARFNLEADVFVDGNQQQRLALVNAFHQVHWEACKDPDVPAGRSGTTCVSCLIGNTNIYTAHVGDSRAILISEDGAAIKTLCRETTAKNFEAERDRIERAEGRIDRNGNVFYGPVGIAMTRSLGNAVMLRAGVIPTPMVAKFPKPASGVIVLATDGIWDVLSNEQVAEIVKDTKNDIAQSIADEARKKWIGNFMDEKVDDITCMLIRL